MTAPALAIVSGGLGDDNAGFDRVPQADQGVGEFGGAIKRLDFVLHVTALAHRTRQAFARTHQPHIMPHDVLDGLHVAVDECWVCILARVRFIPHGHVSRYGRRNMVHAFGNVFGGTFAKYHTLEE